MRDEQCPFCGHHPYEYVDIGVGSIPCAVTCCGLGDAYFRGASPCPETVEMPYHDFEKIAQRLPLWSDMDSAPRDGTDILAWDGNSYVVLFYSQYGNGWTCGDPKIKREPISWMEIPRADASAIS